VGCNTLVYVIYLFGSGLQIKYSEQSNWMLFIYSSTLSALYI
jgi:hypothetical protein